LNESWVVEEWTWTEIGTGGDINASITEILTDYYTKTDVD
jgi:hypothetical protein